MIDIVSYIRKKALKEAAGGLAGCIFFGVGAYCCKDNQAAFWFFLVFAIIAGIYCLVELKPAINPTNNRVFLKYGGPEKIRSIVNEIETRKIYEDNYVVMSDEFIASKTDPENLVRFADVLRVCKYTHSTRYGSSGSVMDSCGFSVADKWGDEHTFSYAVKDEELGDEVGKSIIKFCPNAMVGNNKESQEYILKNKVKL